MSLHTLANYMAAHGRGPDTTLVHMAPTELASLQDLAQRHGGSLTINPHTGLPEAGFLSSLLPMALGAAAQFIPGMQGMGAGMIGAGIGAVHGLASGSLSQGLLAGMSAYSGAGLSGGLLGSGIAVENPAIEAKMKELQVAQAQAANKALSEQTRAIAEEQAAKLSQQLQQMQTTALNKESRGFMDNLSTAGKGLTGGFKNFYTSMGTTPGAFGPKTTLAAGAIPMVLSGIEDSQTSVPTVKSTDSDRGAYANSGATFHPNWVGPYDNKTPGGEKTYAMPYYGADGGLTHMADGGMAEGGMPQQDAYQEYMDYLNKNLPSGGLAPITPLPFKYTEAPAALSTAAVSALTPEYVAPMGTRGGGGLSFERREERDNPMSWMNLSEDAQASSLAASPGMLGFHEGVLNVWSGSPLGMIQNAFDPGRQNKERAMIANARGRIAADKAMQGFGGSLLGSTGAAPGSSTAPSLGANNNINPGWGSRDAGGRGFQGSGAAPGSSTAPAAGANNNANPGWGSRDAGGAGDARGGYLDNGKFDQRYANGGGITALAQGGMYNLGSYSDGGRLLRGPGDGVSDSIPATIGRKQPARLADGEFVIPARIVSEIGNGSTEAGARKLYAMMDRVQKARGNTMGKGKVAKNSRADRYLPA